MVFNPKVSIVIPVYNGSNYLREAIDSTLAQTYRNIEVIVVNDGSDDEGKTKTIARMYGDKIRYFSKVNGGVSSALNVGIKEMTGEYFSWLSHDDIYMPEKVEVQVKFLSEQKNKVILYSDFDCIDKNSHYVRTNRIPHMEPWQLRLSLAERAPVHGCTTLIPKSCFASIGLFDERMKVIQDYDMWARLSRKFEFIHVPQILIQSRVHQEQGSEHVTMAQNTEKMDFFKRYFIEIAEETKSPVVVEYLLRGAVALNRWGLWDAAACGYNLAVQKTRGKGNLLVKYFSLIMTYWMSRQYLRRGVKKILVFIYHNLKRHFLLADLN